MNQLLTIYSKHGQT